MYARVLSLRLCRCDARNFSLMCSSARSSSACLGISPAYEFGVGQFFDQCFLAFRGGGGGGGGGVRRGGGGGGVRGPTTQMLERLRIGPVLQRLCSMRHKSADDTRVDGATTVPVHSKREKGHGRLCRVAFVLLQERFEFFCEFRVHHRRVAEINNDHAVPAKPGRCRVFQTVLHHDIADV